MIYPFVFSAVTTLVIGCALLMQWRRYPGAAFARDIGFVYLTLAVSPLFFFLHAQGTPALRSVAVAGLFLCGLAYLVFLLVGMARLAERRLSAPGIAALAAGLSLVGAVALALGGWATALAIAGLITAAVGAMAWLWLWPSRQSDRWAGPALFLMGLMQTTPYLIGPHFIDWQITVNAVLRLMLGLALLHAGLQRAIAHAEALGQKYEKLTRNSHQGITIAIGLKIVYCNPAFLAIYGLSHLDEATPEWLSTNIPAGELEANMRLRQQVIDGTLPSASWEGVRQRRDGKLLQLRFRAWRTDWNGLPALQTVISDDTEHYDALAALLHQATHDELTGLPNRSALLQSLRDRCQSAPDFGLVVVDIDRFKLFSGAFGHSLGDQVLKTMAAVLREGVGNLVQVVRLGADSFALLTLPERCGADALAAAERVRALLATPLVLPEQEFFVDVSMGIAQYPRTGRDAESLLRAAVAAMHEAKKIAGISYVVAEARYEHDTGEVLQQEQALRAAVINREFTLAYQPKVDARTGALLGFEALARWNRGTREPVPPIQFIAAAERTGLIGALGMLLLEEACRQIVAWRDQGLTLVPVAVNVSPLQMLDPGFPRQVISTLQRHGVDTRWITLEITESAAIDNMEQARSQLLQLRELGLQVAMDDFGTGFSSLAMLRSLPLHAVKIDRSLIDPMPAADAAAVVRAICQLAEVLGLRVVAEGVETAAHAQAARDAGCHEVQGYFFARPLASELALGWLRAGRRPD